MADRLRKMKIQDAESSGEVNEKNCGFQPGAREAEPLPLDAVSLLPGTFLEDPRNRSVYFAELFFAYRLLVINSGSITHLWCF